MTAYRPPREYAPADLVALLRLRIIESEAGCWLWQGSKTSAGYGSIGMARTTYYIHRLMYEALVDSIPEGLEIDHLCEVRNCCNPSHLEPVTHAENMRRIARRRTACNGGHPYSDGNYIMRRGRRECLPCRRAWAQGYRERQRREGKPARTYRRTA